MQMVAIGLNADNQLKGIGLVWKNVIIKLPDYGENNWSKAWNIDFEQRA
jgi:hypothetical protein